MKEGERLGRWEGEIKTGQITEDRLQKEEDRRQRTEDRGKKVRGWEGGKVRLKRDRFQRTDYRRQMTVERR